MKKRFLRFIVVTMMLVCSLAVLGGWTKPSDKAVNMDKLMTKWKTSDNWVFEQIEKFNGIVKETNTKKEWTETTKIERNGNIINRIRDDGNGIKNLAVRVYDGEYNTYYYGRHDGFGYDSSCASPNPSKHIGKIENCFDIDPYLRLFEATLKLTETSLRKEKGVYYFEGIFNMSDAVSNENFKASEKFTIINHFKCSLKFGTSTIKNPIIIKDGEKEYIKDLYSSLQNSAIATKVSTQLPMSQSDSRNKDELIITLLTPEIQKAVTEYYGENRRFEIGDSHMRILKRGEEQYWNIFRVEVKVDTFEGPHNNYFTEFLTFRITPSEITLEDYKHSDFIPNK